MPLLPLVIADLTEASIDGSGVFDTLMRANKVHLEAEFAKNRIKGAEYATVYLGSLDSVLKTSVEFLLSKDKISLESQLMEHKIAAAKIEVLKITAETANLVEQAKVLIAQTAKLNAEILLLANEKLKTEAEIALLNQKTITEKAQVTGLGVDVDSVVGRQKALYGAQTAGFSRDAEQKAAKLMADTWSVRRTTDEGTSANVTNKLQDVDVGRAIEKLLAGVGA